MVEIIVQNIKNSILQLQYEMCNKSDQKYIVNVIAMFNIMVILSSCKILNFNEILIISSPTYQN
jgi:hypothetical protein